MGTLAFLPILAAGCGSPSPEVIQERLGALEQATEAEFLPTIGKGVLGNPSPIQISDQLREAVCDFDNIGNGSAYTREINAHAYGLQYKPGKTTTWDYTGTDHVGVKRGVVCATQFAPNSLKQAVTLVANMKPGMRRADRTLVALGLGYDPMSLSKSAALFSIDQEGYYMALTQNGGPISKQFIGPKFVVAVGEQYGLEFAQAAQVVSAIFDANTDGFISTADDANFDGRIDQRDGAFYRALDDYFGRKYGENYDRNQVRGTDILFALIDLKRLWYPTTQMKPSDMGFAPITTEKKTAAHKESGPENVIVNTTDALPATLGGAGLGIVGVEFGAWMLTGAAVTNPIALVVVGLLGGGIGGAFSQSGAAVAVSYNITRADYFEVSTTVDDPVRVAMFETDAGWRFFIFDASKALTTEKTAQTILSYNNGSLASSESTEIAGRELSLGVNQASSGRWAVQAPQSMGGRVAIYQEALENGRTQFTFDGLFEAQDAGHANRVGREHAHAALADVNHRPALNEVATSSPSYGVLLALRDSLLDWDPRRALAREQYLNVVQAD